MSGFEISVCQEICANYKHLLLLLPSNLNSDEGKISQQIVLDRPTDLKTFLKNCQHRRKYPILYKVEFNVSLCMQQLDKILALNF